METRKDTERAKPTGSIESGVSLLNDENVSGIIQTKDDSKERVVPQGPTQSGVISMQEPLGDVSKPGTPKEIQALTKLDTTATELVESDVASGSPFPSALHLPYHMERLLELFRTCETLVSTLHNRSEVCSFDKIKPAVQEVVRW